MSVCTFVCKKRNKGKMSLSPVKISSSLSINNPATLILIISKIILRINCAPEAYCGISSEFLCQWASREERITCKTRMTTLIKGSARNQMIRRIIKNIDYQKIYNLLQNIIKCKEEKSDLFL